MIRYPMIYLIVIAHLPSGVDHTDALGLLDFITLYVKDGLARAGISVLSCISGFLLFHKNLHLNFTLLFRKRVVSMASPLLLWNIPLAVALYVVQLLGLTDYEFAPGKTMYPFNLMTWLNGVFSVTDLPINFPMYFLRDLFVISLFAPLMGLLIRKAPFMGLIAVIAIFAPNLDGLLIHQNAMFVTFYIGGMASILNWDVRRLDRYAISILLIFAALIVALGIDYSFWLRITAPFLVWPVFSKLADTYIGRWLGKHSRASVFLFMFHGLIVLGLRAIFPNLYDGDHVFLIWLTIPILIAVISQLTYLTINKILPDFLTVLLGGRRKNARL